MSSIPIKPVPSGQTKAMLALGQNLDSVMQITEVCVQQVEAAQAQVKEATRLIPNIQEEGPKRTPALNDVVKALDAISRNFDRFQTLSLWQVVMLVTCVESYLQDVLASAASADPKIMGNSDLRAPYADVVVATSVEALATEMRGRWARGWVDDGGPTRWIERLGKMGARGYPADLAPRLEQFWGIRHVVVHAAGVASKDFVKRHPNVVKAAGDRVRANHRDLKRFSEAIRDFLEPTDRYFLARCPSLLAVPPTLTE